MRRNLIESRLKRFAVSVVEGIVEKKNLTAG